jgi:hypothetical protein
MFNIIIITTIAIAIIIIINHHTTEGAIMDWQQWIYMSKNDLWGSDQKDYYPHLSAGLVGFMITPPGANTVVNASVHMFPGNASIMFGAKPLHHGFFP